MMNMSLNSQSALKAHPAYGIGSSSAPGQTTNATASVMTGTTEAKSRNSIPVNTCRRFWTGLRLTNMSKRRFDISNRKRRFKDTDLDMLCPTGFQVTDYRLFDLALSVTPIPHNERKTRLEANPRMAACWGLRRTDR